MKIFSKEETLVVLITLVAIATISFFNFRVSLRRARDTQRKNDIGSITAAIHRFQNVVGFLPLATSDGRIIGCGTDAEALIPCDWGKDSLLDFKLPNDPYVDDGVLYIYASTGRHFQILGSLEGIDEDEYKPEIVKRNLNCGSQICNFGLAGGRTPLDKSLEEYENELDAKNKK